MRDASTNAATAQASRISAVRPSSHEPASSCDWKLSGRKTLRIPWASHFSGKSDASCCIHPGSSFHWKNTPDANCSTRTTGDTTADAPRPVLGTAENAIPSSVQVTRPRTLTQPKMTQSATVSGSVRSKSSTPMPSRSVTCATYETKTSPTLPTK